MQIDFVKTYFEDTQLNFSYSLFEFIRPLPPVFLNILLATLFITGCLVILGVAYRISIISLTIIFSYIFLLDISYYNNHYYLLALIGFLLCFVNADCRLSFQKKDKSTLVPAWQLRILQFQIFIVYFFAGLAKLNSEWMMGEPIRTFLSARPENTFLGSGLDSEAMVYFLCYSGIVFDLLIGFLLFIPRTFWIAFTGILFFNFTNDWLFMGDIGVFPIFMIFATSLFIPETLSQRIFKNKKNKRKKEKPISIPKGVAVILGIFFLFQLLLPLRHFLYPGNPEWTGEGHRFAWRMKMMHRKATVKFIFRDLESEKKYPVDLKKILGPGQLKKMNYSPETIVQFAHFMRDEMKKNGFQRPLILTNYQVSWNSKPFKKQISEKVNLAETELPKFGPSKWILPYE